jgi:hypothetical protein
MGLNFKNIARDLGRTIEEEKAKTGRSAEQSKKDALKRAETHLLHAQEKCGAKLLKNPVSHKSLVDCEKAIALCKSVLNGNSCTNDASTTCPFKEASCLHASMTCLSTESLCNSFLSFDSFAVKRTVSIGDSATEPDSIN